LDLDYIFVTETHAPPQGLLAPLDGFECISLPRPLCARHKTHAFGGVAIFYKKQYSALVHSFSPTPDVCYAELGILWVELKGSLSPSQRSLFLALCYIPPATSTYYASLLTPETIFEQLQVDICKLSNRGEVICIGDFNARTGTSSDLLHIDRYLSSSCALPNDLSTSLEMRFPERHNQDVVENKLGTLLLSLCKSTGLLIANGRSVGDPLGQYTCHNFNIGRSTVDYVLIPQNFFPQLRTLVVEELRHDDTFDHCAILFDIAVCATHAGPSASSPRYAPKSLRWNERLQECYARELQTSGAESLLEAPVDTNIGAEALAALISTSAQRAGFRSVSGNASCRMPPSAPWYDIECATLRKSVMNLRRQTLACTLLNMITVWHRWKYLMMRKRLRRLLKKKKIVFRQQQAEVLLRDIKHNPRRFWRAFKSRQLHNVVPLERFEEYFTHMLGHVGLSIRSHNLENLISITAPLLCPDTSPLNLPFSEDEVLTALLDVKSGKACGHDGIPAEFHKYAYLEFKMPGGKVHKHYLLVPVLTRLFDSVFRSGTFPSCWNIGNIIPLHKKGSFDDPNNYRGITVGSAISKVYAKVLNERLTTWSEKGGLRALGQAGFRPAHRTTDHIFTLQHLIDGECDRPKGRLYCCFVDFQKAFDTVPREILWARLASLGIDGHMLSTLQAMYAQVDACVKLGKYVSGTFPCLMGVKQGCPLSPTLFGLLIDAFEKFLASALPHLGFPVGHLVLWLLLFADDLTLLATKALELQAQIDVLSEFADCFGLVVNVAKTNIVVFRHDRAPVADHWTYKGLLIPIVSSFKYLGVMFHEKSGVAKAASNLIESAHRAMFAVDARCQSLHIHSIPIKLRIFDSIVQPVAHYACEVWTPYTVTLPLVGPCACDTFKISQSLLSRPAERLQISFLRRLLRLPHSTTNLCLLREFGRYPLYFHWWIQSVKYWNHLAALPSSRLLHHVFRDNLRLAKKSKKCWCARVLSFLQAFNILPTGFDIYTWDPPQTIPTIDLSLVKNKLLESVDQLWSHVACIPPRLCVDSDMFKLRVYHHFHALPQGQESFGPIYCMAFATKPRLLQTLCRFRLGEHTLRIETGRRESIQRHQRFCRHCLTLGEHHVEDEEHFLLECPLYKNIRIKFEHLIDFRPPILTLMHISNMVDLAQYLLECFELRNVVL
jgi:hypothetical protein